MIGFFLKVIAKNDQNKMNAANLAIVFGPCMMHPRSSEAKIVMQDTKLSSEIILFVIENYDYLFSDLRLADFGSYAAHNFKTFSYHTPTKCCCCGKSLSGIAFQGLKCTGCELNCHQSCLNFARSNFPCISNLHRDIFLTISCNEQTRKSGFAVVVVSTEEGGVWKEIGRTDLIACTTELRFNTPVVMFNYKRGECTTLSFELLWNDGIGGEVKNVGSVKCDAHSLVQQKVTVLPVNEGLITITCESRRLLIKSGRVLLNCRATVLSDVTEDHCLHLRTPYYQKAIHESETVRQPFIANWKPFHIDVADQCNGDLSSTLVFIVNSPKFKSYRCVGVGTITLRDLICCDIGGEALSVPLYHPRHADYAGKLVISVSYDGFTVPQNPAFEINTTFGNGRAATNFAHTRRSASPGPQQANSPLSVGGSNTGELAREGSGVRPRRFSTGSAARLSCLQRKAGTPGSGESRTVLEATATAVIIPSPAEVQQQQRSQLQQQQLQLQEQLQRQLQQLQVPQSLQETQQQLQQVMVLQQLLMQLLELQAKAGAGSPQH
eukprot:TRINITY_DN4915_c0_g1_i2.p1 TRINITY_DN4915_c0_g1~~TRINITY_DN4915_c0_g1_i2.p1  ORF type:complete len:550 (+),score=107.92 TRINITY_DN4915_c0_g1_i2:285-1934(+)